MSDKKPIPTTISIPGGKATFYRRKDLPPRRERELTILFAQLNPHKMRAVQKAQTVTVPGGSSTSDVLDGPDIALSEREARLLEQVSDVGAWAYLKSWTLRISDAEAGTSVPRPLPATPDDILDLPRGLYDAITRHAAKLVAAEMVDDDFTVDAVEDDQSPTGA